jgi:ABC-type glycerol-3-phosphate transport system substrate-binding protein
MKKTTVSVLTAAVALTVLAAGCKKSEGSKKAGAKVPAGYESVTIEKGKDGKTLDLGGIDVILADWWSGPDAEAGEPTSAQNAAERAWHDWTESTYNYNITQKELGAGWDNHPQDVANFCMTGGDENYVFTIDARSGITGLKSDLFFDLSTLESIDWSKKKWDQGVKNMLTKGSSFYAMRALVPEPRGGVFFNKRLLEESGIDPEEPYNLQKAGKWTWDTFEQLLAKCTRDLDNDGIPDTYGMANSSTEFVPLAAMSNGVPMIGKNAEGKFVNNVGNDAVLEALAWCAHLSQNYEMPQPEGSNWDWIYPAFINGQVAFQADQEYNAQLNGRYQALKDDWGFVCFPLGPKGDGKYRTLHNDNMYVIPSCYDQDRAEKIAKAFDLWTDPTPGYDDGDSWKEGYYACFRDPRAVDETLQLMLDSPNPRYDTLIPGINYMGDVIWVTYPGYVTPQQAYEETKNSWQALLDDANNW